MSVAGLQASDYRDRWPAETAAAQSEIFKLMAPGVFRPVVGDIMPLAAFHQALAKLRDGRAEGKIVLTTGRDAA